MSSSTAPHGDDVYQSADPDDPAVSQPDMENALDEPGLDENLDTGYSPPERPWAVNDHGTTPEERHAGESLEGRLARENPEVDADPDDPAQDEFADETGEPGQAGPVRAGRLVLSEEAGPGGRRSVRARDVGVNGGAASAEEAAVHLIEEEDEEQESEGGT
ncbi:hypothetical protein J7E97_07630 [Streptomyces sp. ISL-66]|uniref:DUF5709 domain-containing protein n=1 Tax=Streptomyces sp. ISL-66 TaxID=2819186 RepID=UPI001BEB8977|nr:DUF5709 domain-containing protein [Streptomyces sp. ISL-66]MBT2467743.1 hypothetical protein [Streptomyces sp. ISL-66]